MDTNEPIPILMNTHAGALHAPVGGEQLIRMARDEGFAVRIIQTHGQEQMGREIERLVELGTPRIGIAGGDGTVEAAAQHLAHTNTALGILSQGTFNNVATALGIPHNLPAALRILCRGRVQAVDLGKIGDKYFAESAGIGLFADGLALYGQGTNKNLWRGLSAGLRILFSSRSQPVCLIIDGNPAIEERMVLCEIANTYRIAQAVPIAPHATISDGVLDVVVIGNIRRRDILPYLKAMRAQMHLDLPQVHVYQARREIRIETPHRKSNVHADDCLVGATPVVVKVVPGALKVLVSRDET